MLDTIRIKTKDEQTAATLAHDLLARYHPELIHEREEWQVLVETESEDDLPDLLGILYDQLHARIGRSKCFSTVSHTHRASAPENPPDRQRVVITNPHDLTRPLRVERLTTRTE